MVGAWLRPLVELPFLGLLLLMAAGLVVLAQRPLRYDIAIGREDGPGSDLPFVYGWNTAEVAGGITYRWSADDSRIELAGLPRGPLVVTLRLLQAEVHPQVGSGLTTIATPARPLATLPLPREQRILHLLLPATATPAGTLTLQVRAPTWTPANDPRALGVAAGDFVVEQVSSGGSAWWVTALAPVRAPLFWPLPALAIIWLPLRRWSPSRPTALAIAALVCCLLLAVFAADRPRFVLAGPAALTGLGWALLLAIGLRVLLGAYTGRLGVRPSARLLDALVLLFFALFALRYMGRLYPFSMPGDIGFHVNRENDVIRGNILLVSRHRGIDFPYPPALYLLLLPLRLLPIAPETLVDYAAAFFGALGLFPIAYLALRGFRGERIALLAASVYVLLAPAIMALWWSFLPHIFAQELAVAILAGMAGGWPALDTKRGIVLATCGFVLLFASHFGFYLNISLLIGLLLCVLILRGVASGSRSLDGRRLRRATLGLAGAFVLAQFVVLALFYSAYLPLIVDKLAAFQEGGMGAVQGGRAATPWPELLRNLWRNGLGGHYALIGVPLALLGGYRLRRVCPGSLVPLLFASTLIVALIQGAIPFVTSSTITTRWLSFAAWIVALGAGLILDALWSRGRAGRLLALMVLGWIGWTTLWMWLQALAFRVRPPEPF